MSSNVMVLGMREVGRLGLAGASVGRRSVGAQRLGSAAS
jgi:hypothetical protein